MPTVFNTGIQFQICTVQAQADDIIFLDLTAQQSHRRLFFGMLY